MYGLYISRINFNDGTFRRYGIRPNPQAEGSRNFNRTFIIEDKEPIAGMWGYESTRNVIKAISPIVYNMTDCPYVEPA